MIEPLRWSGYFSDPGGTLLEAGSGRLWARYLHFLTSGLAVGGLSVAVFGRYKARHDAPLGERAVRTGMHSFTMLTLLQLGLGVWYLVSLPRPVMLLFMGGSKSATGLLAAGLALTLGALAAGALRKVGLSAAFAVPLVYVMAFLRDAVRDGYLKPFHAPEALPVAPQYSPFLLFVVTLVVGAAVVAWMLRKTLELYRDAD